jgi:hypothetical protein
VRQKFATEWRQLDVSQGYVESDLQIAKEDKNLAARGPVTGGNSTVLQ